MKGDRAEPGRGPDVRDMATRIMISLRRDLNRPDPIGIPFIVLAFLFAALLIFSPLLIDRGTIDLGNDGSVGKIDHDDVIDGIENPVARFAYRFGDRYCHQKDHRSLFLNGNQMPVCARDIGLFAGIFLGSVVGAMYRRSIKLWVLLLFLVPMAVDGGFQSLTSYESWNPLRVATGLIGGTGIGIYVNGSIVQTMRLLLHHFKRG